ncbi:FtsX-like permease family protein [Ktedonosporobacter rubrisoli]|uniref:FtsX-like permease family protein n=1 Tax=Ktedonosporobacter rubrisoli TaxID=2509675 RepID=A0A4P6K1E0_KTERU|nr:ABC transporter permease [Ktedonosporobacter rubrisoli]QBD81894.1 FtsX-like permease family protein [Ktedonosporobacter rubrisoli]
MDQSVQPHANQEQLFSQTAAPQAAVPSSQPSSLESMFMEFRTQGQNSVGWIESSFRSALEALWANRLRSLLTGLGIIIGIAAVIGAITLTRGVGTFIDTFITAKLGANTIIVTPGAFSSGGAVKKQAVQSLTLRDLQAIERLPHVAGASPYIGLSAQVVYENQSTKSQVAGVSSSYQSIQSWQIAEGFWFSAQEDAGGASIAVIGDSIAHDLFEASGVDPIGQQIRIRDQIFRVEGVLAPKGGMQDAIVFVPYKAAQARLLNQSFLSQIGVEADSRDNLDQVVQDITATLERDHHTSGGSDFQISTSLQILKQEDQATQQITLLMAGVAAISLTIGGIGIMNIMLVSVTERTREIGIRMSVGAKRRDIRNQFLVEALFMCIVGGIIGMVLGALVGWLMVKVIMSAIVGDSVGSLSVPFIITPDTLLLPFIVSALIAVIFGLYPAVRASRLDPVAALRHGR